LTAFFLLGTTERERMRQAQIAKQREAEHAIRETQEKLKHGLGMVGKVVPPDWTYTEEDRDSALGKMTSCAVSYDPNAPSALKLTSFQGLTLTPQAFKEAVRTTFNLVLKVRPIPTYLSLSLSSLPHLSFVPSTSCSRCARAATTHTYTHTTLQPLTTRARPPCRCRAQPKEHAALFRHFCRRPDDTEIDSKEFLHVFLQLGVSERHRTHKEKVEKQRRENEEREAEEKRKLLANETRLDIKVETDFTDEVRCACICGGPSDVLAKRDTPPSVPAHGASGPPECGGEAQRGCRGVRPHQRLRGQLERLRRLDHGPGDLPRGAAGAVQHPRHPEGTVIVGFIVLAVLF